MLLILQGDICMFFNLIMGFWPGVTDTPEWPVVQKAKIKIYSYWTRRGTFLLTITNMVKAAGCGTIVTKKGTIPGSAGGASGFIQGCLKHTSCKPKAAQKSLQPSRQTSSKYYKWIPNLIRGVPRHDAETWSEISSCCDERSSWLL